MLRTLSLLACVALGGGCAAHEEPRHEDLALASWRGSLRAGSPGERRRACEAVGRMGRDGAPAVSELVALLADPDLGVRAAAAEALPRVGPDAIAPLERRLGVDVPQLERTYAARALIPLVPAHDLASSVLVESLTALREPALAERALRLVVDLGAALAPRIATLVDDPYVPVRVRALEALGAMREGARAQTPVLLAQLASPEPAVRLAAVRALAAVGPREAVLAPLREAARDADAEVARAASELSSRLDER